MNQPNLYITPTSLSWNIPYTFSGKEKDSETGYSYFGARYYDSDISVWLSVDPLSDMYPSTSPYMYTLGNPVMLIDPNGMNHEWVGKKNEDGSTSWKWDENIKTEEQAKANGYDKFAKGSDHYRYTTTSGKRVELQEKGKWEYLTNIHVLVVDGNGSNDVGHTATQIGNTVYGYYPTDKDGDDEWDLIGSTGEMKTETRTHFDSRYSIDGITDFTLEVTESQSKKIEANLKARISKPGTYSLFGDQCTSVAVGALIKSGVNLMQLYPGGAMSTPVYSKLRSGQHMSPGALKVLLNRKPNSNIVTNSLFYGGK